MKLENNKTASHSSLRSVSFNDCFMWQITCVCRRMAVRTRVLPSSAQSLDPKARWGFKTGLSMSIYVSVSM